ncbi:MAG: glycosyltransferase family 2 protein [Thermodesulfovibrionales bacterium]
MDNPVSEKRSSVAIVVLNWNGRVDTAACLDSLKELTYPAYEVLLIDNGSVDGSQTFFREQYPWVTLIENVRNLGFAAGNNVGISYSLRAGADYVLLLNNDTVVDPAFLDELVRAAEARPDVGILNPKIYYFDPPEKIWYAGGELSLYRGLSKHYGFQEIDRGQHDLLREVSFITGCAFLIKRGVIEKIGLLDEYYFCYSEDADWSVRALRAGFKGLYVPSSRIWHRIGASTASSGNEFAIRMGTRNALYLVSKHAGNFQFAVFLVRFSIEWILKNTIRSLIYGDFKTVKALAKGILEFRAMKHGQCLPCQR